MFHVNRGREMSTPLSDGQYFATAMEILGESGPEGLTIAALCRRLRVTKGSFYHHFGGLGEFVTRFLTWWADESVELVRQMESEEDPRRRLELASEYALAFRHEAEAAIRAWGRSVPEVAGAVRRVDGVRQDYLAWAFQELGLTRADAQFFARLSVDLLVGRQSREVRVDIGQLSTAFNRVREIVFAFGETEPDRRPPGRPVRAKGLAN
jgi:AcrR family transcriptional regulator